MNILIISLKLLFYVYDFKGQKTFEIQVCYITQIRLSRVWSSFRLIHGILPFWKHLQICMTVLEIFKFEIFKMQICMTVLDIFNTTLKTIYFRNLSKRNEHDILSEPFSITEILQKFKIRQTDLRS